MQCRPEGRHCSCTAGSDFTNVDLDGPRILFPARQDPKAAVYLVRSDIDLVYHDEVQGDLFEQVHKAMELLTSKYLKAVITYRGLDRIETLPVPEAALRAHPSRPFNPHLANTFFRAGEIEAWGRGIQKIRDACAEAGTPEPCIEQVASDWHVEFPFAAAYLKRLLGGRTPQVASQVTTEVTTEVDAPGVRLVLALEGEMGRQALQDALGLKNAGAGPCMPGSLLLEGRMGLCVALS